ncbi:hypothetical protein C8R46DRAFT_1252116 [Mycena filopes]|nr:hypothetical protein C8R46DRAFT_1252116 [Mycena filopes]
MRFTPLSKPSCPPLAPPHLLNPSTDDIKDGVEDGPPVPPKVDGSDSDSDNDYGPALPPDMRGPPCRRRTYSPTYDRRVQYHDPNDSDDDVGPRPLPAGVGFAEQDAAKEFMAKEEKRRKEAEDAAKPKAPKRDEWMLVPPTSSVLGNLDPTKLKPRQFARTSAAPRGADNTLWTETPAERQQRLADEVSGKKRRAANSGDAVSPAEELATRKRQRIDEELRRGVEEHTRKVRGSALVDMHARAGMGEEKDETKGIWDRDRDMALSGRLMDEDRRNKMLQEAKGLGDRFGTGTTGGFY